MIVKIIRYSRRFEKAAKALPQGILVLADEKIVLFRQNPLHPSLRLHQLHGMLLGKWSISVTNNYRIIFRRLENGDILFLSIGKHDIYKHL